DFKFSFFLDAKMENNNVLTFQNNLMRKAMGVFKKLFQWDQSKLLFKRQHQWVCLIKFWIKDTKYQSSNSIWVIWVTLSNTRTNSPLMIHSQFLVLFQTTEQVI